MGSIHLLSENNGPWMVTRLGDSTQYLDRVPDALCNRGGSDSNVKNVKVEPALGSPRDRLGTGRRRRAS